MYVDQTSTGLSSSSGIVRQNGQIIIPSGEDVLRLHDDVIVVTTDTSLRDIRDILR